MPSPYRDDARWGERLTHDHDLIRERIGQERMMSVGKLVSTLDERGPIDFLVVWGSAAREGIENANDVDVYFEAPWIPADEAQKAIEVRENHDGTIFHGLGWASGRLLINLRNGWGMGFAIATHGLVFVDRGPYREALSLLDEEELQLAPGETMDKPEQQAGDAQN